MNVVISCCPALKVVFAGCRIFMDSKIFRYELYTLAVGSCTQNTSFPLSSDCKASLCSDFKANPSSWASKSRGSTSAIIQRKRQEFITRNDLLKTLLDSLLTACIEFSQWENFPWLGKRRIRTNITYAKRTVRIFSVSPQSHSLFSASFQTFRLTARAYLNTQKYGLFCSLRSSAGALFLVLHVTHT